MLEQSAAQALLDLAHHEPRQAASLFRALAELHPALRSSTMRTTLGPIDRCVAARATAASKAITSSVAGTSCRAVKNTMYWSQWLDDNPGVHTYGQVAEGLGKVVDADDGKHGCTEK